MGPLKGSARKGCSVVGCLGRFEARGFCQKHYWRWKTHGDPASHARQTGWLFRSGLRSETPRQRPMRSPSGQASESGTVDDPPKRSWHPKRYRIIKVVGHPLAHRSGRIYEHRLVFYGMIGDVRVPCFWCARPLRWVRWRRRQPADALIVDHLDHDRRNNEPKNLVPACGDCNSSRSRWRRTPMIPMYSAAA